MPSYQSLLASIIPKNEPVSHWQELRSTDVPAMITAGLNVEDRAAMHTRVTTESAPMPQQLNATTSRMVATDALSTCAQTRMFRYARHLVASGNWFYM